MPEDRTAVSSSDLSQWVADSHDWYYLAPEITIVAIERATDAYSFPGSATTTSTVVVSDGSQDYTVTRDDIWDSRYDVGYVAASDLATILGRLTANTGVSRRRRSSRSA